MADTTPLSNLIAKYVDERTLADIAREYGRGRLLFIATTNLDAGQSVIWNIGAIGQSGHPDALRLIRRILLASASIPAMFPPVMFDVTYEDGTKSSRRKINAVGLQKDEIEDFARTEIMTQDRKIAEMSGKPRGNIKELSRSS